MSDFISHIRATHGERLARPDYLLSELAAKIGCEAAVLAAILDVESKGLPFDQEGRLVILTEKHVFWRELPKALRTKAVALGLATKRWAKANYKGLGKAGSDARWDRLEAMGRLHETAALRSSSYGGPQIMGFNHKICGFSSVHDMVQAFADRESAQIEGFFAFLERSGLAEALRQKDFRAIARRYNGSGQVETYARLMIQAYEGITGKRFDGDRAIPGSLRIGSSGYRVKALQERLVALGYHVRPDGDFGPATRRQVVAFQADHGIAIDGVVGPQTEQALEVAVPIPDQPGGTRENMTVKDLRETGSRTVKTTDTIEKIVVTTGAGGIVAETLDSLKEGGGVLSDTLDHLGLLPDLIARFTAAAEPLLRFAGNNKWLLLIGLCAGVWYLSRKIKAARLDDAKNWRHVG